MEDLVNKLKELADKHGMVDVGRGAAQMLGVTQRELDIALSNLEDHGYLVYGGRLPQVTVDGKMTTIKVLCRPGTEWMHIFDAKKHHISYAF